MKEYIIYYIGFEDGQELNMVGSGFGNNESEAVGEFKVFCDNLIKIKEVKFYKDCGKMFEVM